MIIDFIPEVRVLQSKTDWDAIEANLQMFAHLGMILLTFVSEGHLFNCVDYLNCCSPGSSGMNCSPPDYVPGQDKLKYLCSSVLKHINRNIWKTNDIPIKYTY